MITALIWSSTTTVRIPDSVWKTSCSARYAACAEVVCEVIEELGLTLTEEMARGIYIGASTDTGCFKFSNTTANTHRVAAKCLDTGLDGGEINRALFETKSRARYEIERMLFRDMKFYKDGRIAVALITREAKEQTGADWDDLDAIAGIPRQIEGVEVGLTLTELKDGSTKISARTTKEVDAAAICSRIGRRRPPARSGSDRTLPVG